ncbi:hypothetical protein [Intrasporangium mesophilum]
MGRRRDHHPRFYNVCPDPDACERFGHYEGLAVGDSCECCGQTIVEPEPRKESPDDTCSDPRCVLVRHDVIKGTVMHKSASNRAWITFVVDAR